MNINGSNISVSAEWMWKGFTVLLLPAMIYVFSAVLALESRVTSIEASRFTSSDGVEVWKAIALKANSADVPPSWFLDRVKDIESRLVEIERRR